MTENTGPTAPDKAAPTLPGDSYTWRVTVYVNDEQEVEVGAYGASGHELKLVLGSLTDEVYHSPDFEVEFVPPLKEGYVYAPHIPEIDIKIETVENDKEN